MKSITVCSTSQACRDGERCETMKNGKKACVPPKGIHNFKVPSLAISF